MSKKTKKSNQATFMNLPSVNNETALPQPPAEKQPCIIFHGDVTCTEDQIVNNIGDIHHTICMNSIIADDDNGNSVSKDIPLVPFCDHAIANLEIASISDNYKNVIYNGDAIQAAKLITDTRNVVACNIAAKLNMAINLRIMNATKFAIDELCGAVARMLNADLAKMISDAANEDIKRRYGIPAFMVQNWIDEIGVAARNEINCKDQELNLVCDRVGYSILTTMVEEVSKFTTTLSSTVRAALFATANGATADEASAMYLTFNDIISNAANAVMDSMCADVNVILNDIIVAAATTYATAELPSHDVYPYF